MDRKGTSVVGSRYPYAPACGQPQGRGIEVTMSKGEEKRIVEISTAARPSDGGLSMLALLVVSIGLVVLIVAIALFVFIRG